MCRFGFGYFGGGLGMMINMVLGIALLVGIIIWVTKLMKYNGYSRKDAIQILDEKFVSGEINEEEYMKRKEVISKKS